MDGGTPSAAPGQIRARDRRRHGNLTRSWRPGKKKYAATDWMATTWSGLRVRLATADLETALLDASRRRLCSFRGQVDNSDMPERFLEHIDDDPSALRISTKRSGGGRA